MKIMKSVEDLPYSVGDDVYFISRDAYYYLPEKTPLKVLKIEPGIFSGDFYTTVEHKGKKVSGHYWRFKKV